MTYKIQSFSFITFLYVLKQIPVYEKKSSRKWCHCSADRGTFSRKISHTVHTVSDELSYNKIRLTSYWPFFIVLEASVQPTQGERAPMKEASEFSLGTWILICQTGSPTFKIVKLLFGGGRWPMSFWFDLQHSLGDEIRNLRN